MSYSFYCTHKRRPCTFGQSLWSTNCLVNFTFFWSTNFFFGRPKTNFSFFWSTNFFLVNQKPFSHVFGRPIFFWSTKFIFGQPKKKLVDQKKWEIDRTIGRPRDWPKVHGRRYRQRKFSELAWLRISWYSQNFSSLIKLLFSYSQRGYP